LHRRRPSTLWHKGSIDGTTDLNDVSNEAKVELYLQ